MKIVKVTYTTQAGYAEQNKANIAAVMSELHDLGNPDINYHVCVASDEKTFTHTAFFKSEDGEKVLLGLPVFKHFQEQLKASAPESAPKQELLSLVGSSVDIFKKTI